MLPLLHVRISVINNMWRGWDTTVNMGTPGPLVHLSGLAACDRVVGAILCRPTGWSCLWFHVTVSEQQVSNGVSCHGSDWLPLTSYSHIGLH